ncbi:hypothetical protein CGCF415_v015732 [Colletotrichum fructicola]|uniref:Uncharacterized protein n=1 Tax=Colletotrichum fructicola (strain Nara gc5) TaxID=1213859 RepID=A0A7J6IM17_COLFN|nr:hypothetical protein CGGC5_v014136 [Colletotrichum fructicola Nara gc5]KAF4883114.1 hypothetical protein CGCFRS4_v013866 [Colletotrichum fructicola]KAF4883615.1 hypothetical protein CGCF415_v015732 [Colletotrichum fructicola]KAF4926236.1 hypothetical protein CGCF245_v013741 [Colletotrichum fructicola]
MGTFGQYTSIEDVLAIPPPKTAKNGKIRSSSSLSNQLKSLGHRAGYAEPPRFHDLRAANLHNIDRNPAYTDTQRMIQAGHDDPQMHRDFYASVNPGVDGQGTYLGDTVRDLGDIFRDLEIPFNPNQPGTLPAQDLEAVMESEEYQTLEKERIKLRQSGAGKNEIRRLRFQQSTLINKALQKLRLREAEIQDDTAREDEDDAYSATDEETAMCVPVSVFRLKPVVRERHLLSQLLFQIAPIRNDTGKKALELLVELYRKETETSVRPGLETALQ